MASFASACFLLWVTWAMTTSAWYLSKLYGGLGQGMGAVLIAVWGLVALLTLPFLVWGLLRTRTAWLPSLGPRKLTAGVALLGAIGLMAAERQTSTATAQPLGGDRSEPAHPEPWTTAVDSLAVTVHAIGRRTPESAEPGLNHGLRAVCEIDVDRAAPATVLVHYVDRAGKARAACIQARAEAELAPEVAGWLEKNAGRGAVMLDRLTAVRGLSGTPGWLAALSLRPGIDGVCLGKRCLAPWQLVAQSRFVTHSPLPFLGDLKFGASLSDLARAVSGKDRSKRDGAGGELMAITSHSVVITADGEVTPLVRMHPTEQPLTAERVKGAGTLFESHILAAQQENGQFRYTLDPFTRVEENRQLNLARQAGTVFALCDVGSQTEATNRAARLGLQLLVDHHVEDGERWALAGSPKDRYVRLGESALPLVALLTCRSRVGSEFDAAIAGLSRFILSLQRRDGSFATDYDWRRKKVVRFGEALYAPGQALLGLTLLDRLLAEHPELSALGDAAAVGDAIQRGMNHVAHEHWDVAIYPFFFVEENWNCLAARAALPRQRNADYERFCLDYVAFKSRLILSPESGVAPEFVGGFGFGNLIPPHNTGAAGFGEALAASIAVRRARGDATSEQEQVLAHLLGFLLRQQWTAETCPACSPLAIGSMSEHIHSPITRIDFGQHAWAALSNGAAALGLTPSSS